MKTVWITGASRGIGAETARTFAANGYAVAINYCRSKNKAAALAEEIIQNGGEAFVVQGDVSDKAQADRMVKEILTRQGRLDVLIHNAGIAHQGLLTDMSEEDWHRLMGIHLDGAFYCSRAVIPHMIQKKNGVILTVSSMWGVTGASCEVAYSAAKAGLIGFSKALAKEVGPSGVRVNCVAPGVIDTDMCSRFDKDTMEELQEETPLMRIGTPKDVAESLLFLASDAASFITGQVLGVNGGFLI